MLKDSEVAKLLRKQFPIRPGAAIILGTGLDIFQSLIDQKSIPYMEVFGVAPAVSGHTGSFTVGKLSREDVLPIAILRGRFHLYEGFDWSEVTLPARVISDWGVPVLILTNAAGGI